MNGSFQYEWWTVQMTVEGNGVMTAEYKGKSRDHVIRQIEKEIAFTNSEKNLSAGWKRQSRILDVFWNTLTLDRVGHQREF